MRASRTYYESGRPSQGYLLDINKTKCGREAMILAPTLLCLIKLLILLLLVVQQQVLVGLQGDVLGQLHFFTVHQIDDRPVVPHGR